MIIYTFCTFIALSWLCYRLYKFVTIPVTKIVSTLKIGTPPATKVSIDKISKESITIHWENEPITSKNGKRHSEFISHYLLYLNNLQVAIFPNSSNSLYTCCSITGLESGKEYQLDFITVNNMGFINKLPSLYCMTRDADMSPSDSPSSSSTISNNISNNGANGRKNGKWRRNTLAATASLTDTVTTNSNFTSPAYATLTSLKDLESFSIDDLKKILICAQEDLHDVLSQQSSLLEDFQESKLQLELELDNLKNYWSHEIDLRKSLRSNIKSLENTKLLSDLKLEKINKNIDQTRSKISKMEKDMQNWSQQDQEQFNKDLLRERFDETLRALNNEIESSSKSIKTLQHEISLQEERNKKLNSLKKNTNSSQVNSLKQQQQQQQQSLSTSDWQDSTISLPALLKRINDSTIDRNGSLNSNGEDLLLKLNSNSSVAKLVREQLRIDQELDSKWKNKKNKISKRIETLESMFTEISATNRQLRANLIVQPYGNPNSESNSISNSNSNSNLNLNSTVNNQTSSADPVVNPNENPAISSPPISNRSLMDNFNTQAAPMAISQSLNNGDTNNNTNFSNPHNTSHLILHNPSTYSSNDHIPPDGNQATSLLSSQIDNEKLNNNSFPAGRQHTASLLSDPNQITQVFPWGSEQQQRQQTELEQAFEYDNANHLISGLQNMIYDETDYPESISNYSKGFTTDQLDNYWTNQRMDNNGNNININNNDKDDISNNNDDDDNNDNNKVRNKNMIGSLQSTTFSTPLASSYENNQHYSSLLPFGQPMMSHSPSPPPNLAPSQSLLAATLADASFSKPLSMKPSESFHAMDKPSSNTHHSSSDIHGALSSDGATPPIQIGKEIPLVSSNHESHEPNSDQNRLQSPRFNFMWHPPQQSPSIPSADASHHVRNPSTASNGSNHSTWSKLNWKNWSPQAPNSSEEAIDESPTLPHALPQHQKGSLSPSSSSGRRMSRLLSRSGMNNIFKLPSHEEKK